jgi:hypothetical protein
LFPKGNADCGAADLAGNVSGTFQDDIILDVTAPTGSVRVVQSGSEMIQSRMVDLILSATDDVSGVGSMRLSNRSDFSGSAWQDYATSLNWDLGSGNTVYAQFRDNAGNVSVTYSASTAYKLFLPMARRRRSRRVPRSQPPGSRVRPPRLSRGVSSASPSMCRPVAPSARLPSR